MTVTREIVLGCAFVALFAWVVFTAAGWEPQTATFPLLIGVTGLGLAVWAVAGDVLSRRSASTAVDGTTAEDSAKARGAFLWIAVFFALVLLVGFRWGLLLAVLGYYRVEARVSWIAAVTAALVCAAFLHVAVAYLYLPLYRGFLFQP